MAILYETPVIPSEYTDVASLNNGTVTFSGLDPSYGYEIHYVSPDGEQGDLTIPKWTKVNKVISGSSMTLKYTISGATAGAQFRLKKSAV